MEGIIVRSARFQFFFSYFVIDYRHYCYQTPVVEDIGFSL